ncbi:MAG: type II toxin-antitoxin system HipA family toxin [bacterium]|nr:type II toxin-antitoxin system HipA family toxin [bacterium]
MITTAFVNIWGERVGAIAWDATSGLGSFEYETAFLKKGLALSPLMMPVSEAVKRIFTFADLRDLNTFKGLPGLVADVLPDKYGHALINAWLAKHGRASESLNPVELLCFIGSRGMGALEFEPVVPKFDGVVSPIELNSLISVAEGILSGRKNFRVKLSAKDEKGLLDILKIGTSAGGARAKAVIAFNPKTKELRSGQAAAPKGFSQWIIKFDGVTDHQMGSSHGYGRVEMAYYLMAKAAGIRMSESRLLEEHGRAHFMTRRFDREHGNKKLHFQSFCALCHFDFNDVHRYSYEQLFETMRLLALPYPQAEQLYRRMVFNVMARNCDDHTKNFAFLMDQKGVWSLSPAFDVCHAYRPGSDWVSQHSLSINGKRKNIERSDLMLVAQQMSIKKASYIIKEIAAVVREWNTYANYVGVETKLMKAIEKTLIILD